MTKTVKWDFSPLMIIAPVVAFMVLILFFLLFPIEKEQPYIVRYGTVNWNHEKMELLTEDGTWTLEDPPEYENDTKVRILFDSKGTKKATDDVVVDLIEMED